MNPSPWTAAMDPSLTAGVWAAACFISGFPYSSFCMYFFFVCLLYTVLTALLSPFLVAPASVLSTSNYLIGAESHAAWSSRCLSSSCHVSSDSISPSSSQDCSGHLFCSSWHWFPSPFVHYWFNDCHQCCLQMFLLPWLLNARLLLIFFPLTFYLLSPPLSFLGFLLSLQFSPGIFTSCVDCASSIISFLCVQRSVPESVPSALMSVP